MNHQKLTLLANKGGRCWSMMLSGRLSQGVTLYGNAVVVWMWRKEVKLDINCIEMVDVLLPIIIYH